MPKNKANKTVFAIKKLAPQKGSDIKLKMKFAGKGVVITPIVHKRINEFEAIA
ncbi:hypothetical protein [Nostoc sp. CCY 9925]|uniref:hypothetical protein n=1 Tax=Nostoc sp. CCY 9925 TaxID=3103865 RepID=UPI0039C5B1D6